MSATGAIVAVIAALVVIALILVAASVRVLREYERAVVFRLGRLLTKKGPGVVLLIPFIDRLVRVSLRTVTQTIPPQEVITRDNVPARVTAVTYFHVVDPSKSVVEVEDAHAATSQIAQTTLRSVLGQSELDSLLAERERLNEDLQKTIDEQTEPWGIKVTAVEIKDVEIPEDMRHAIARQAEAERERRAKIINAEGEAQAATKLGEAAEIISRNPLAIQLRYLQTLLEIGSERNSTVVFPLPIDLIAPLTQILKGHASGATASPTAAEAPEPATAPAAPGAVPASPPAPSVLPGAPASPEPVIPNEAAAGSGRA